MRWFDSCGTEGEIVQVCDVDAGATCVEVTSGGVPSAECQCPGNWTGDNCDVCPENFADDGLCSTCANLWGGEKCNECPPKVDANNNCSGCRYHWTGETCDVCATGYDPEKNCNECLGHLTGESCDVCPGNWDGDKGCVSCKDAWTGEDCEICVRYVDKDRPSDGLLSTGLNWSLAFRTVGEGIAAAGDAVEAMKAEMGVPADGGVDGGAELEATICQVWVTGGAYYVYDSAESDTVQLEEGVHLYGGFAGTETQAEQRDPTAQPTVLDGYGDATRTGGQVWHVVTGADRARLDSVVVANGNADGSPPADKGGGLYLADVSMDVNAVVFVDNQATSGGAIYASGAGKTLTVEDTIFQHNSATDGGGFYNGGTGLELKRVTFVANSADHAAGVHLGSSDVDPKLIENGVFYRNSGDIGGDIMSQGADAQITNCTFEGSTAPTGGPVIYNNGGMIAVTNSVLYLVGPSGSAVATLGGGTSTITYSDYNFSSATGNMSADPKFEGKLDDGTLSTVGFTAATYRTAVTDSSAVWTPGALAGQFVLFTGPGAGVYAILTNTADTLYVAGAPAANNTTGYEVQSLHLKRIEGVQVSPCVDKGDPVTAPDLDRDGNRRIDQPDLGAYETTSP